MSYVILQESGPFIVTTANNDHDLLYFSLFPLFPFAQANGAVTRNRDQERDD